MEFIVAILFLIFTSGISNKYIIAAMLLVVIAVPVVYNNLPPHALKRIEVFLNPGSDPRGDGYNILQSQLAVGSGQLLGMGFGKGNQTQLGFLHPKTTDFIFSVIGEELGFIGTATIIIVTHSVKAYKIWPVITGKLVTISFIKFLPSLVFKSAVYNPWPNLNLGIFCPGFNAFFIHSIDFATLSLKQSFSPAWILTVNPSSSVTAYWTNSSITGFKSDISFISSPIKSLPTT